MLRLRLVSSWVCLALVVMACGKKATEAPPNGPTDAGSPTDGGTVADGGFAFGSALLPTTLATLEPMSGRNASTEATHLVAHQGALYVGLGHWMQTGPRTPAQILVKRSPTGSWAEFASVPVARITALKSFTIPSTSSGGGEVEVLVSQGSTGTETTLTWLVGDGAHFPAQNVVVLPGVTEDARSLAGRATATGYEFYAGVSSTGIYRGTWNAARQTIDWGTTPELSLAAFASGNLGKVGSMTECSGHLYAAVQSKIYRRNNADGAWRQVRNDAAGSTATGYRGLTCLGNALLLFSEPTDTISRLENLGDADLPTDSIATANDCASSSPHCLAPEANLRAVIAAGLGVQANEVAYTIAAYNEFLPVLDESGQTAFLAGVEWSWTQASRKCLSDGGPRRCQGTTRFDAAACYLRRTPAANYEFSCLGDASSGHSLLADNRDGTVDARESFTAIRTIRPSPFGDATLYFGGYDANSVPSNDTAWVSTTVVR